MSVPLCGAKRSVGTTYPAGLQICSFSPFSVVEKRSSPHLFSAIARLKKVCNRPSCRLILPSPLSLSALLLLLPASNPHIPESLDPSPKYRDSPASPSPRQRRKKGRLSSFCSIHSTVPPLQKPFPLQQPANPPSSLPASAKVSFKKTAAVESIVDRDISPKKKL